MRNDQIIRQKRERNAKITGILMTVVLHVCALVLVSFSGLKYLYHPPQEQSMLIDFSEEPEIITQQMQGREPLADEIDPEQPVDGLTDKGGLVIQVKAHHSAFHGVNGDGQDLAVQDLGNIAGQEIIDSDHTPYIKQQGNVQGLVKIHIPRIQKQDRHKHQCNRQIFSVIQAIGPIQLKYKEQHGCRRQAVTIIQMDLIKRRPGQKAPDRFSRQFDHGMERRECMMQNSIQ